MTSTLEEMNERHERLGPTNAAINNAAHALSVCEGLAGGLVYGIGADNKLYVLKAVNTNDREKLDAFLEAALRAIDKEYRERYQ